MLDRKGFDLWADGYDQTVQISEENNEYPFAGYKEILNTVFNEVMQTEKADVLDIGFGTGVLTKKLYDYQHKIDGIDFSSEMIKIARDKMPNANLIEWDISKALPGELLEKEYDYIILTYSLHHLKDSDKVKLIRHLLNHLSDKGKIIIGDVSFETEAQFQKCKSESLDYWDSDEFYIIYESLKHDLEMFSDVSYKQISHCGGVTVVTKK